jgi:hypothetical protein
MKNVKVTHEKATANLQPEADRGRLYLVERFQGCETKFFELNFPAGFLGWFD